jgi:hypothetical protein
LENKGLTTPFSEGLDDTSLILSGIGHYGGRVFKMGNNLTMGSYIYFPDTNIAVLVDFAAFFGHYLRKKDP